LESVVKSIERFADRSTRAKINCPTEKILLAMRIDADSNERGKSLGTVSRSYVGKDPSVHPCFERFVRPALRGDRSPFQWVGGKRAVYS
jgi:hypothetical protein